jgi:hypothetical protein
MTSLSTFRDRGCIAEGGPCETAFRRLELVDEPVGLVTYRIVVDSLRGRSWVFVQFNTAPDSNGVF